MANSEDELLEEIKSLKEKLARYEAFVTRLNSLGEEWCELASSQGNMPHFILTAFAVNKLKEVIGKNWTLMNEVVDRLIH